MTIEQLVEVAELQQPALSVHMLGSPQVRINGEAVDWHSRRQAETIFYYLALKRGAIVPEDELMRILWSESASPRYYGKLCSNLQANMSHLRRSIAPDRRRRTQSSYVVHLEEGYVFQESSEVWIDVEEFEQACRTGRYLRTNRHWSDMASHYEKAIQLYRGHLLEEFERKIRGQDHWITIQRLHYWQLAVEAVVVTSAFLARQGDADTAIELCRLGLGLDDSELLLLGTLIVLLQSAGQHEHAHRLRVKYLKAVDESQSATIMTKLRDMLGADLGLDVGSLTTTSATSQISAPLSQALTGEISPVPTSHNIPEGDLFVGRESTLRLASETLERKGTYITVSGDPGFGASAFVAELARRNLAKFPGGVIWIEAASSNLYQLTLLIVKELWSLEVPTRDLDASGFSHLDETILRAASARGRLLIVVDNVRSGNLPPSLLDFLSRLPTHSKVIFVTSVSLALDVQPIEHFHIGPLTLQESKDLFQKTVKRHDAHMGPMDDKLVASICFRIAGYPRGVIAAATRARILPLDALYAEIQEQLPALPAASIQAATENLSPEALHLLLRIASFPESVGIGSFDMLFQEKNWVKGKDLVGLLSEIFEQHLITFDGHRYRVLQVLREGLQKQIDDEEWCKAQREVHLYLEQLAEQVIQTPSAFVAELGNLTGFLDWAEEKDRTSFLKVARAVDRLLELRGSIRERSRHLMRAIHVAAVSGDRFEEARFLNLAGNVACKLNEHESATDYAGRALQIQTELGRSIGVASNLGLMARIHYQQGDYVEALDCGDQSVSVWEQADYPIGLAHSLIQLGKIHRRLGNFEQAKLSLERGLDILGQQTEPQRTRRIAEGCAAIGDLYLEMRDYARAREQYLRMQHLNEGMGDTYRLAVGLTRLAESYRHEGRFEEAQQCCENALRHFKEIENRRGAATCWNILANISYDQGNYRKASEHYQTALREKELTGDRFGAALSKFGLAKCMKRQGEWERAEKLAYAAHQDFKALQARVWMMKAEELLEGIEIERGTDVQGMA